MVSARAGSPGGYGGADGAEDRGGAGGFVCFEVLGERPIHDGDRDPDLRLKRPPRR